MNLEQVLDILEEKRRLLLGFEEVTQRMLTCGTEQLEKEMGERQRLLEAVQKQERELEELCSGAGPEGEALLEVARGQGEVSQLSGEMLRVYEKAMELRAVLSRFPESEVQAMMRLRLEQEKLLEKIKTANQRGAAKAARFYVTGAAQSGGGKLGKA